MSCVIVLTYHAHHADKNKPQEVYVYMKDFQSSHLKFVV